MSTVTASPARTTPHGSLWQVVEYQLYVGRRIARSMLIVGVFTPLAYVLALGVGLGAVVNSHSNQLGVPYLVFVAPAFLTAAALQIATADAAYPIMAGFKWIRTFHGMAATPLTPAQICDGQLMWVAIRIFANSLVYLAIMAAFGGTQRWWVVLAVPVATLTAMSFAAPIAALAATLENEGNGFNMVFRFVVTPMFLFSGTFYPISELPTWGQWLAYVSPLYHGTELARGAAIGHLSGGAALGHLAYLIVLLVVGLAVARWRFRVEADQVTLTDELATLEPSARASAPLRILPMGLYAGRSHVVLERAFKVYRRAWMLIFSGFFEPLFYLFSLGTGLHHLVGNVVGPGGHVLSYTAFIAPALASSAMNGAIYDSTMNVFFKMKYGKIYDAMLATSLGPMDVAVGEIAWALIRGGIYSAGFMVVMVAMGLTASWWAVAMLPAALLIAFAFGAIGMAVTTYMKTFQDLDMVQVAVLPMFLFSGTFYGLDVYPTWLRWIVECLPLNHGIELLRELNAGVIEWSMIGHLAYFVAMAGVGVVITAKRLDRLLLR